MKRFNFNYPFENEIFSKLCHSKWSEFSDSKLTWTEQCMDTHWTEKTYALRRMSFKWRKILVYSRMNGEAKNGRSNRMDGIRAFSDERKSLMLFVVRAFELAPPYAHKQWADEMYGEVSKRNTTVWCGNDIYRKYMTIHSSWQHTLYLLNTHLHNYEQKTDIGIDTVQGVRGQIENYVKLFKFQHVLSADL